MALKIIHQKASDALPSAQLGPYKIASLIPESDEAALTAYRVTIEPHQTTSVSYHKTAEEIYHVLSGSGIAILNGEKFQLSAGDFLRLPPGTTHGFVTAEESLEMLDIHSPGSRPNRDVYFEGAAPPGFNEN